MGGRRFWARHLCLKVGQGCAEGRRYKNIWPPDFWRNFALSPDYVPCMVSDKIPAKIMRMPTEQHAWKTMTPSALERRLGDFVRARLPGWLGAFLMFVLKQGWAALFGGAMLAAILITKAIWQDDWGLARYDALLIFALIIQMVMIVARLETLDEVKVILLFHLTGTVMEWFKVAAGSWAYPEPGIMKIAGVPLFSGFMYAAVGSYIARVIRLFRMRFTPYPPFWVSVALASVIYVNFFAHHWLIDARNVLFAATIIIYWRTRVWFHISERALWMPLPVAAFLSALALYIAENIGVLTKTWVYAGQGLAHAQWEPARLSMIGSWYLLLYVSFVTVTLVLRDALQTPKPTTLSG